MRISSTVFTLGSLALTAATVANAFVQKKQFYPAIVYITKSSPSMAVMYVQALILVYVLFQIVRKIFFGDLRASESEHLSERAWHAVMETCLAFAVFRDDFSPVFVAQFVILLFVKSFHWLCDDRVDMMERSPVITLKFHIRMLSLLAFLSSFDSYFVSHAYFTTLQKGASAQIVFGFEYSILMALVAHVSVKYMLHMYDARAVHPWEQKAVYLLYAELLINFIRCVLYAAFVLVMMKVHTFPLFSVRPFYLSVRALHKAFSDVVLSRRAINAMNNRFPLATEADLADVDTTCIICREEMTVGSGAKKLPCGHIFHANCLRSWFQRQQTCPTCRTDILNERRPGIVPPQGAQDNAVPPAGAFPPPFPAFLAQQFGFVPPPPPREQRPGQDAGANAVPIPPPPPFMPPPGFLSGLPGLPPFPLPPVATAFPAPPIMATLTDAELRELEGSTRSAVEARLRALSNIAVLLDAATAQFQQYIDVARRYPLNIPSDIHAGGGDGPSTSSETSTSSTNINEAPRSLFSPSSSNSISTEEKKATVSSSSEAVSAATTADEIRRRRLQRLGEDPDNSSPPPEERAGPSSS